MENVLLSSYVIFEKGILWLSVLNVEEKSVLLQRLGRWLVDEIRVARRRSLQSDSSTIVERLIELY